MTKVFCPDIKFSASIYQTNKCPTEHRQEIACAGRSNAGKSSLINCLFHQKKLARVSKTPGCTPALNFYTIPTKKHYFVDLPGYGYAKTNKNVKQQWASLMENYLSKRQSLHLVIIVMDIRRPLQKLDYQLLDYLAHTQTNAYIVLTKSDKISTSQAKQQLMLAQGQLANNPLIRGIQTFSSLNRNGKNELISFVDRYLELKNTQQQD